MSENIWDQGLPQDEGEHGFKVAVPGEYTFQVESVTGKEYTPKQNSKIKRCAEIDLKLRIEGKDKDGKDIECYAFDRLYGDPTTIWKMTSFAKSIGVFKTGMTPGDLMRSAGDGIGVAKFGVHEYNGNTSNEVKSYIPKEERKSEVNSDDLPF